MATEKKPKNKIVGRNGLYDPKIYNSAHFYMVDDIDPAAQPRRSGNRRPDAHTHKCTVMEKFVKKYTNWEVHNVRFPQGSRGREFFAYWREELRTKTSDDLVIIWFHGNAGGEEKEYKWTLSQYPKIQINAFELIRMVTTSAADSYFLLDCFFPTRWTYKFKKLAVGNNEINARAEDMQYPDGRHMDHEGEFTESIADNLKDFFKGINDKYRWGRRKKMLSIPDILAVDEVMHSNPKRYWLSRTKYGDTTQVKRFRICPKRVRRDEKIEIVTVIIQGPPEEEMADIIQALLEERRLAAEGEGDAFDDEALGELFTDDEDNDNDDDDGNDDDDNENGNGNAGTASAAVANGSGAASTEGGGDDLFVAP